MGPGERWYRWQDRVKTWLAPEKDAGTELVLEHLANLTLAVSILEKDNEQVHKEYALAHFYLTRMSVFCKYVFKVENFTDDGSVEQYQKMVQAAHQLSKHFVLMESHARSGVGALVHLYEICYNGKEPMDQVLDGITERALKKNIDSCVKVAEAVNISMLPARSQKLFTTASIIQKLPHEVDPAESIPVGKLYERAVWMQTLDSFDRELAQALNPESIPKVDNMIAAGIDSLTAMRADFDTKTQNVISASAKFKPVLGAVWRGSKRFVFFPN